MWWKNTKTENFSQPCHDFKHETSLSIVPRVERLLLALLDIGEKMAAVRSLLCLRRLKAVRLSFLGDITFKIFPSDRFIRLLRAAVWRDHGLTFETGTLRKALRISRNTSSAYGLVVQGTENASDKSFWTNSSVRLQSDQVKAAITSLVNWCRAPSRAV